MKTWMGSLVILGAIFALPSAWAARWIVVNPEVGVLKSLGLTATESLRIGTKNFLFIEDHQMKSLGVSPHGLQKILRAEKIEPDFPIGLVKESTYQAADPMDLSGGRAWHVEKLLYHLLPSARDGKNIVVAVLDTGVDYTHTHLAKQMWVNHNEIADNQLDDDGNGFIDDIYGYDFADKKSSPKDTASHGTHVAGIIAAESNVKTEGIAPGAKIMAIRIIANASSSFLSDAARGIIYAVDNGAQILSNSWRIYKSWDDFDPSEENLTLLKAAIEYANSKGVLFVAAAGNESTDVDKTVDGIFPVHFKGLRNFIIVASSDQNDKPSSFTNYGLTTVHVAAPGTDILSTVVGGKWQTMSGTSMATPIVSGLLARGLSGGLTMDEAIDRMMTTTINNSDFDGKIMRGIIDPLSFLSF